MQKYLLAIGDRTYSSWSLRGWLLFEAFGLPVKTTMVGFRDGTVAEKLKELGFAPAQTVPALKIEDGVVLGDSLAAAEELASRHPDLLWPADARLRAVGRSLAAEMHSSFTHLRSDCPMNLRTAYEETPISDALARELKRLDAIWAWAREEAAQEGPWLLGSQYSIADAFFAPVAARVAGYGLPLSDAALDYVHAHLAHGPFRRWKAMAAADRGPELPWYAKPHLQTIPWPEPPSLRKATAVDDKDPAASASENTLCPYSGEPATHFLQIDGRVFGFCNAYCRDKTVADPTAFPRFTALL
mmetsp:Transcript_19891/g.61558  ORF Transcript_19891/g.61558 Transcript_19891/m.61558 type:complete len:300 (-) Transcript_19891:196-1095(-)